MDVQLSPHFWLSEFESRDGAPTPGGVLSNLRRLAPTLEVVRLESGGPLRVGSGYRSPAHNAAAGGAPRSLHLRGLAVDLRSDVLGAVDLHKLFRRLIARGAIPDGGLGLYMRPRRADGRERSWAHYDLGRAGRRWRG